MTRYENIKIFQYLKSEINYQILYFNIDTVVFNQKYQNFVIK